MTKRLYDNGRILRFSAVVQSCMSEGKSWAVILDQTAFFPGGGGQVCDSGRLGSAQVIGMREQDGEIVHVLDAPLTAGQEVDGEIAAETRLRRMQNHSGEHILSGLFHREYGLNNVGFHMGSEDVTLDLDGELTHEQLMRIETMANCIVRQNIPISIDYPSPDVLTALDYRSKLDLRENVRIVSIGENGCVDRCACCAPHVTRTGEIGMIKILDHIRYKGGIRIHMLCGMDALEDYRTRYEAVSAIAASLSAKQKDVVGAVERLCTEIGEEKARQSALCQRLISLHTAALSDGEPAILFEAAFGANDLRRLVNAALEITHTAIALSGDDAAGYTYVLGSRTQACRAIGAEMHAALGGRGGGSDAMVQGRIPATRTEIDQWWKSERL